MENNNCLYKLKNNKYIWNKIHFALFIAFWVLPFLLAGVMGGKIVFVLLAIIILSLVLPHSKYSYSEVLFFDDKLNIKTNKDKWVNYYEIKALHRGEEYIYLISKDSERNLKKTDIQKSRKKANKIFIEDIFIYNEFIELPNTDEVYNQLKQIIGCNILDKFKDAFTHNNSILACDVNRNKKCEFYQEHFSISDMQGKVEDINYSDISKIEFKCEDKNINNDNDGIYKIKIEYLSAISMEPNLLQLSNMNIGNSTKIELLNLIRKAKKIL